MDTDQILNRDCLSALKEMPDAFLDMTLTSPPYDNLRDYEGYTLDVGTLASELWRTTKPGGVVVWVVGDATLNGSETGTSFRQALLFQSVGFNIHDTMIYMKDNPPPTGAPLDTSKRLNICSFSRRESPRLSTPSSKNVVTNGGTNGHIGRAPSPEIGQGYLPPRR